MKDLFQIQQTSTVIIDKDQATLLKGGYIINTDLDVV